MNKKLVAEHERVAAEIKAKEMESVVKREREELQVTRDEHAIQIHNKEQDILEKTKEVEEQAVKLVKYEEELKARAPRSKLIFPNGGPDSDLYDAIQYLGDTMKDGMRNFRNLASGIWHLAKTALSRQLPVGRKSTVSPPSRSSN